MNTPQQQFGLRVAPSKVVAHGPVLSDGVPEWIVSFADVQGTVIPSGAGTWYLTTQGHAQEFGRQLAANHHLEFIDETTEQAA